jgi:hypothetical protein
VLPPAPLCNPQVENIIYEFKRRRHLQMGRIKGRTKTMIIYHSSDRGGCVPPGPRGSFKFRAYPYNKTRRKWAANIEKPTYYPESLIVRNYLGSTVVDGTIILKWSLQKLDVHGSAHHNINLTEMTNKIRPCSRIYYSSVS